MQFGLAPFTNRAVAHKISLRIEDWQENGLDIDERTELLKDILKKPMQNCITTFLVFMFATILWGIWFRFRPCSETYP